MSASVPAFASLLALLTMLPAVPAVGRDGADHPLSGGSSAVVVRAHDFATLTEAAARQRVGRPARYLIEPDSLPMEVAGQVGYDCVGIDGGKLHRTVFLPAEAAEDALEVEAVLQLLRHPPRDGFEGFTELRLTHAQLVR